VRDDEVEVDSSSGLISILGGKWTTHRAIAEDTINAVEEHLKGTVTPSLTPNHPLSGAVGYDKNYPERLASKFQIVSDTARHLAETFGMVADKVLAPTVNNPRLLLRLVPEFPAITAEVLYSIRYEMAVSIEDILARRTGLQVFSREDSITAAPHVAQYLADELGWSQLQKQKAANEYKQDPSIFGGGGIICERLGIQGSVGEWIIGNKKVLGGKLGKLYWRN
jgi:glycerol-3-phosphate dehydrogenase